ncbi:MAG: nitroreductase family protein [Myxococcota bacterium]
MTAPFDLEETDRLLSTTRAVRKRLDLDRPVEREVLEECIQLSQQAPTGSNNQGWRWLIVRDPSRRKKLADLYRAVGEEYLREAARDLDQADPQTRRVYGSALYLLENLEKVPVHVIPCLLGRLPDDAPAGMQAGFWGSIFPAVWSFQLALRSRGLGSALTTIHLGRADEAAELLGIPDTVTQAGLLPVAYTVGTEFKVAARRPAREITYWDGWKQS